MDRAGPYSSKCYVVRELGGTRFDALCCKGWVGGQNG